MQLRSIFLSAIFISISLISYGQFGNETQSKPIEFRWHESPQVKKLLDKYTHQNAAEKKIPGFRVQLFFGERDEAQQIRTKFLKSFPDMEAEIDYLAPNFRVRVGKFRSHLDAYRFHSIIKSNFQGSYIVQDKIDFPELTMKY
ncbi:MAG: hypothetical protein ACI9YL_000825 [Luteibaculaceae bacterium]|jgi:hypothetical protein